MGMPSISILLHELTKMLNYAGATNVVWIVCLTFSRMTEALQKAQVFSVPLCVNEARHMLYAWLNTSTQRQFVLG
jgi:hypothetical protein